MAVMEADFRLKGRQAFWNTERKSYPALGVLVAAVGTAAGVIGFKAGEDLRQSVSPPVQVVCQPGSIVISLPMSATPTSAGVGK